MRDKVLEFVRHRLSDTSKNVFTDEELDSFIWMAVTTFNSIPPFTNISLSNGKLSETIVPYVAKLTVAYALASKALIERGREVSIADGGINYTPPNVADLLQNQYIFEMDNFYQNISSVKTAIYIEYMRLFG